MQHWKQAEKDFEASFDNMGKGAYVHRLTDTAAAKATAGKNAFVVAQPSDYLVVAKGSTFFAEVKSTTDNTSFHFSNLRKNQIARSRQIVMAGGVYLIFIKSVAFDRWYCIPAQLVHETSKTKQHLNWTELEPYAYEL